MKILITGGAGFIGTNFISHLLKNNLIENPEQNIVVIDNLSHGTYLKEIHGKTNFIGYDIRNVGDSVYEGVDVVYHFAGLVSIYDCDKNRIEALDNNIMGSVHVFENAKRAGVKKVIYAETSAVYEDTELPGTGFSESQKEKPRTLYAASKLMLRNLALSYARLGELNVTGLRFFNVYGDHQDFSRTVPPAACGFGIRTLQGNQPIIFGDGNRRRDFVHVHDVVSFLEKTLDPSTWEVSNMKAYNIGTGKSISLIELIKMFHEIIGVEYTGYIQMDEINGEAFEIFADILSARTDFNWEPVMDFKSGHASLIQKFKEQIAAGEIKANYMNDLNIQSVKIGK